MRGERGVGDEVREARARHVERLGGLLLLVARLGDARELEHAQQAVAMGLERAQLTAHLVADDAQRLEAAHAVGRVADRHQLRGIGQVDQLHAVLKPYLLRRVKEDVEKSMPPKTETILEVSLTPSQKKFYKAIYERNTTFLFKGAKPKNQPSLMNVITRSEGALYCMNMEMIRLNTQR